MKYKEKKRPTYPQKSEVVLQMNVCGERVLFPCDWIDSDVILDFNLIRDRKERVVVARNLDRLVLGQAVAKGINIEAFFTVEPGEHKLDECGLVFCVKRLCPAVEFGEGQGSLHGFVVTHGRGSEMDAEGKGRKRKGETRLESTDRKFVDLYPSLVWTRRLGAEIEIENTRKNRQAGVDAGVRLRASH